MFIQLLFVSSFTLIISHPTYPIVFLLQDVSKINEGKPTLYQDDTNKRILNSLELLTGLDEDAVDAKRLQHPQAEMIEQEWVALSCSWASTNA